MSPENPIVKRAKKVVDAGMNIPLANLSESIETNEKLDALLTKEVPSEMSIKNFPEVQTIKIEGLSTITLKGDKGDSPTNEELLELITPLIPDVKDGEDYILTEKDKKDIASKIKVPVIEKVIEKTEVIREQPIVTNQVKEVAVTDTPEEIVEKINSLSTDSNDYKINVTHISGIERFVDGVTKAVNGGVRLLTSLLDVKVTTPTNGQALVYDSTLRLWKNSTVSGGGGHTIQDEGTPLTQRTNLNFVGAGVTVTDGGAGPDSSIVTINGGAVATPTGTGFTHITAGVQDAAAKLVDTADINANQVTNAKLAQVATATFKGRTTAGTGDSEDLTIAQAKTLLNLTGTNSGDQTSIVGITGTLAQFNTAITDADIVPTTTTISTTAPLSGGGDLSANRTLTTSMATNKLIGRGTAGTGVMEEITLGTGLSLTGTTLNGQTGSVTSIAAQNGVETTTGSAITTTGTVQGNSITNTQTGLTYTYVTGDRGKTVIHSNAAAIAGTLPQAGASFPDGWYMRVTNGGAGTLTITPTISTINGAATLVLTTGQGVTIVSNGTNYFAILGKSAGGGSGTVTSVGSADGSVTVTNPTTTPDLAVVSAPAIRSATTTVNTSSATAPTNGQVLTATSSTTATWQTPSGGTPSIGRTFALMGS